jgi:hypothetical protein
MKSSKNFINIKKELLQSNINDIILLCNFFNIDITNNSYDDIINKLIIKLYKQYFNMNMPNFYDIYYDNIILPWKNYKNISIQYFNRPEYRNITTKFTEKILQSFLNYVEEYVYNRKDENNITKAINKMYMIENEIILYRGQDNGPILNTSDRWFSTSLDIFVPLRDEFIKSDCCLFVLYIQPGVKLLPYYKIFNYKNEYEVFVQSGGKLEFIKQDFTKNIKTFHYKYSIN